MRFPPGHRVAVAAAALLLAGTGPALAWSSDSGVAGSAQSGAASGPALPTAVAYVPPLPGTLRVVHPFEPPPTPYSAGHRGVDLATRPAAIVRAAADGRVIFAGAVAGRGVVVLLHADGVSTEYEPVTPSVRAGQDIARGAPVGRVSGSHEGCLPDECLHWGARHAGVYFDPLSLLGELGVVRLLPWT
jgi:murein DD-endopeptidase MepM/ murein hydrolase activator NlpD